MMQIYLHIRLLHAARVDLLIDCVFPTLSMWGGNVLFLISMSRKDGQPSKRRAEPLKLDRGAPGNGEL